MAFFESLGGFFGARKQRKTAKRGRKFMERQLGEARGNIQEQLGALFGEGGAVPTQYAGAREALRTGTEGAMATIGEGYAQAGDVAREGITGAIGRFDPYAQQGTEAFNLYNQALQGGEGAQDAFSQFQESTGYGFLRDEMQRATQRQFAARGQAGSGNVLAALQERSSGLAQQSYTDFLGQLMGSAQMGLQATGAQAGMEQGMSQFLAGLETERTGMQAGLESQLGQQLADLGVSEAALETGVRQGVIGGEFGLAGSALGQIGELYGLQGASQAQELTAGGGLLGDVSKILGGLL